MNFEEQQNQIEVHLVDDKNLWRRLAAHTNEMVIEKRGRGMFPTLDYHIRGLDARKEYEIVLEFHRIGETQYAFEKGKWVERGISAVSSEQANRNATKIRSEKQTGRYWMSNGVNFKHVKLTNWPTTKPLHVVLHPLFKYNPVMTIYEVSSNLSVKVVSLDHTQFIAVMNTLNNPEVNELKIRNNPMAGNARRHAGQRREYYVVQPAPAPVQRPVPLRVPALAPLPAINPAAAVVPLTGPYHEPILVPLSSPRFTNSTTSLTYSVADSGGRYGG